MIACAAAVYTGDKHWGGPVSGMVSGAPLGVTTAREGGLSHAGFVEPSAGLTGGCGAACLVVSPGWGQVCSLCFQKLVHRLSHGPPSMSGACRVNYQI